MHENNSLDSELGKLFSQQKENDKAPEEDAVFTQHAMNRIHEHERQFRLLKTGIRILSVCALVLVCLVTANWLTLGVQALNQIMTTLLGNWRILAALTLLFLAVSKVMWFRRRI